MTEPVSPMVAHRFTVRGHHSDFPFHAAFLLARGHPASIESHLHPLRRFRLGDGFGRRSLSPNQRERAGICEHLLGVFLGLAGQAASLLIGQLAEPFIRELYPAQLLEHPCGSFRGPRTAHQCCQFAQSGCDILSLDLGQAGRCRTKAMAARPTAESLEGHFHTAKTREEHTPLCSLGVAPVASARGTGLLLLFALVKRFFEGSLHGTSSCGLDLLFHFGEARICLSFDLQRSGDRHERSLPVLGVLIAR